MYIKSEACAMRKTKEEAEITKQKIMDAALRLFKNKGFDATRLQDIAKAAGMTRGAIYWHFKNKLDILTTLMLDMKKRFEMMQKNFQEEDGAAVEKLERLIREIIIAHTADERFQDLIIVMMSNYQLSENLRKHHFKAEFPTQFIETVSDLTRQGMDEGVIRRDIDPNEIAWLVLILFTGSIITNLKFPNAYRVSDKSDRIVDCFMHGILT
jgi:TetR/AcrR family acrAB operon transcriptional repressor